MAAPRRSRRLASQEPEELGQSTTSPMRAAHAPKTARATTGTAFDLAAAIDRTLAGDGASRRAYIYTLTKPQRKAIIDGITDRNTKLEARIEELEERVTVTASERDRAVAEATRKRSLQQAAAQERIQRQMAERRAAAEAAASQAHNTNAEAPASPTPTSAPAPSTPSTSEPQQQQALTITTTSASPPAQEATPAVPKWRRYITSAASLLSPFGRRTSQSHQPIPQIEDRKRSAPEQEDEPTPKRARTEETKRGRTEEPAFTAAQETPTQRCVAAKAPQSAPAAQKQASSSLGEITPAARKRSAPSDESTPKPSKTPHLFVGPSAKNHKVPTSLSTITEYSETSRLSIMSESTPAPSSTPSKMPHQRRSIAGVRASRLAGAGTPRASQYSWDRASTTKATTPRPAEINADARFAKVERMKQLERELEQLKRDSDVLEMESHRRKRVKVDQLAYIPHNKPGDSEGTFRVPDIDSDDEMEVEYNVPERVNVFEEASRTEKGVEQQVVQEMERTTQEKEKVVQEVKEVKKTVWNFPSVGKRRPDQEKSAEYCEAARVKFVTGFEAWKLLHGY